MKSLEKKRRREGRGRQQEWYQYVIRAIHPGTKSTYVDPKCPRLQIHRDLIRQRLARGDRTLRRPHRSIVIVCPVEEVSVRVERGTDVP
jgi:hypothetical protein